LKVKRTTPWSHVQADIDRFPHELAAWALRRCAEEGVGEPRLLKAFSKRAVETAPPELRSTYARWAKAIAECRRVGVKEN
jgi:hypothetical protein